MNFTWDVEPSVFRSAVYLSRRHIESEEKKEYKVYKNNPLLIKGWDLMYMRNDTNYSMCAFRNINYTDSPNFPLRVYYCNSSYNPATGGDLDNSVNCVHLYSLTTSDLDTTYYSSRNSSYSKTCFSVINNRLDGVKASEIFYYGYYSQVPAGKSYLVRYANGSSGTNVSFNDSKVAWYSSDDGSSWTQAEFTPDIWYSGIVAGDQLQTGVYVEDLLGNNYTNLTLYTDDVGLVNLPITTPDILSYYSSAYGLDEDLNGTHSGIMTIKVGVSKDPNALGTVNHSLYLTYPNGTIVYTINKSFYSPLDTPINITFNTSLVSDGIYKINVTAVADDNPNDIRSFLTAHNFTIANADITPPYFTYIDNVTIYDTESVGIDFNASDDIAFDCWGVNDTTHFSINCSGWLENITALNIGVYYLNITINDTAGNENFTIIYVNVTAVPDTTPPQITNISSTVTTSTATITWTTDEQANSTVYYGTTQATTSTSSSSSLVTSHSITLTGLSSSTLYYYNVSSCDSSGNCNTSVQYTFTTSTGGGGPGCTDDCDEEGQEENECVNSTTLRTRTCGDYDADSCLEWSSWNYVSCGVNEICQDGACISTAEPELEIELIKPEGDINVTQNEVFNVSVKITCLQGYCGEVEVALDPLKTEEDKERKKGLRLGLERLNIIKYLDKIYNKIISLVKNE